MSEYLQCVSGDLASESNFGTYTNTNQRNTQGERWSATHQLIVSSVLVSDTTLRFRSDSSEQIGVDRNRNEFLEFVGSILERGRMNGSLESCRRDISE